MATERSPLGKLRRPRGYNTARSPAFETFINTSQFDNAAPVGGLVFGSVLVGGIWKDITEGYVLVSGAWKTINSWSVLIGGAWKTQ